MTHSTRMASHSPQKFHILIPSKHGIGVAPSTDTILVYMQLPYDSFGYTVSPHLMFFYLVPSNWFAMDY